MQVILFLQDASLGLQDHNLQVLKRGQFLKNGDVGLSHVLPSGSYQPFQVDIAPSCFSLKSEVCKRSHSTHKSGFCRS